MQADNRPNGAAGEEYDALQLLIVEEVVEGPQAALLSKRVTVQIRVVAGHKQRRKKMHGISLPAGHMLNCMIGMYFSFALG